MALTAEDISKAIDRILSEQGPAQVEAHLESLRGEPATPDAREAIDYYLGVVAFNRGDRDAARQRFTDAAAAHPDSLRIRFALAQELLFTGNKGPAFELFDGCPFPAVSSAHALAACRYAYLFDEPERGLRYLEPIFAAYRELGIADDHFLYMRGLPFLSRTVGAAATLHWMRDDAAQAAALVEELASTLHDYDFERLQLETRRLVDHDDAPLANHLDKFRAPDDGVGPPGGFSAMQRAAIVIDRMDDVDEATVLVSAVSLGERDFPWLEDIRTALLAKLRARAGDEAGAAGLVDRFLAAQPLLFEPDHAFTFDLLSFQEPLKSRVRLG